MFSGLMSRNATSFNEMHICVHNLLDPIIQTIYKMEPNRMHTLAPQAFHIALSHVSPSFCFHSVERESRNRRARRLITPLCLSLGERRSDHLGYRRNAATLPYLFKISRFHTRLVKASFFFQSKAHFHIICSFFSSSFF